jgi:glycosyltransferase involved in cell wall biosynthesis
MSRRRDLSTRDVSDHAAGELEYVLSREKKQAPAEPTISVEEAMAGKPVYKFNSTRDVTRVLFISTDVELLNPTTQTLDGYVEISDLFDEVHILVMRTGIPPKNPVLRASNNVWIYTVSAPYWWELPSAGMRMVDDQLVFAAGFRPDLIVARDPMESAWLAHKVAEKYHRPAQLHIVEDFTSPEFIATHQTTFLKRLIPNFTIGKFASVRTLTDAMASKLKTRFELPDLQVLPRLQNYETLMNAVVTERLSEKYRGLSVFLLYIGDLTLKSGAFKVLEATRYVLRNQRIGLIIIGDGPARAELQKQAKQMNIEKQVVFEKGNTELLPYLKGAHMLLVPDITNKSEELILQGAATGIPLLIAPTERRKDIFDDKYSAYFIDPENTETITNGISDLLNDVEGRAIMAKNAQTMIADKFHFDITEYAVAYRASIEEAFFVEPEGEDAP